MKDQLTLGMQQTKKAESGFNPLDAFVRVPFVNEIIKGDSRELIKELPENSIDLLVTDPPYFVPAQSYVGKRGDSYRRKTLADATMLETAFIYIFELLSNPLKPSASAYVFCDGQSYPMVFKAMFPHFKYVRPLIWDKKVSYNGYTWRHQHEIIAWGEGFDAERIPTGDGDILRHSGVKQKDRLHDAEKPIQLIVDLIKKHGENKLILDPFAGSCPVAAGAKLTNNHFICFEYEQKNVDAGYERLKAL